MAASIALLLAGSKGASFLPLFWQRLQSNDVSFAIEVCNSYPSNGLQYDACEKIRSFCSSHSINYTEGRRSIELSKLSSDNIFVIGWQYLLEDVDSRIIVFHDSLLPRLRGYNPTVTALICGETCLGATTFKPDGGIDTGPIVGQRSFTIAYPISVKDVYERLASVYVDLAFDILNGSQGNISPAQHLHDVRPTYSIWRDDDDYFIDWNKSANEIQRFIDAVGWPYLGAKALCCGTEIRVHRAHAIADLRFAIRQPGKLLAVRDSGREADVICGSGILRLTDVRTSAGEAFTFDRLRMRLSRAFSV